MFDVKSNVDRWTLDVGPWTLDLGHWTLNLGRWTFSGLKPKKRDPTGPFERKRCSPPRKHKPGTVLRQHQLVDTGSSRLPFPLPIPGPSDQVAQGPPA